MKRTYYKKPKETFDVQTQITPTPPTNLVYILQNSTLSQTLDFYRGKPSDTPNFKSFELILTQIDCFFDQPADMQAHLIVNNKQVPFLPRETFTGNVYQKTFKMEQIAPPSDKKRLIFVTDAPFTTTIFEFQLAIFNKILLNSSTKMHLGRKIRVSKVRNEAEIYGISRFRGGAIKFNKNFKADILSPNLDRIVGSLTFFAKELTVDESVEGYELFKVMPWSPDPRMSLVSGKLREAQVQTYDMMDQEGFIVEI